MTDLVERLRLELASRAIRSMGPRSPFWNCTICGAAHQTPIAFRHKPGCILENTHPPALVDPSQTFHYSIEVQNGIMVDALRGICLLNHGATSQAAAEALNMIGRERPVSTDRGANSVIDLVERVASLNPDVGEIGAGMLKTIVGKARALIGAGVGK